MILHDTKRLHSAVTDYYIPGTGNNIIAHRGSNVNLAITGRNHGLDGFVNKNPSQGNTVSNNTIAQTVEAILGAVWIDSKNMATVHEVMKTVGLA